MNETHFAYKISKKHEEMTCSHFEFEEHRMLDVLKQIQQEEKKGIYWIFKKLDGKPQEALAIIDCEHQRIYYHYSGDVESLGSVIAKLSQSKNN